MTTSNQFHFATTIRSRIVAIFLVLIGIHLVQSSHAGAVSLFFLPPTGTDAASGVDSCNSYICALVFGGRTNSIIVNGVPFQRVHLNGQGTRSDADISQFKGVDLNHGGTWSVKEQSENKCGFVDTDFDFLSSQADGEVRLLLSSGSSAMETGMSSPGDRTVTVDLGGLRPGTKYSLRYYYCQRQENAMIGFSFYGENKEEKYPGNPLNLGGDGAAYIKYDFIAATNHVTMQMKISESGKVLCLSAITLQKLPEDADISVASFVPKLDPKYGMGSWIWGSETHDQQKCRFWKSFVIPSSSPVNFARLRITGDDHYQVMLDGRVIGGGDDWRTLTEYDLHFVLNPGIHILAVEGMNDYADAGVILGLLIQLKVGQIIEVGSDSTWKVVPNYESEWTSRLKASSAWQPATVIAAALNDGAWQGNTHPWSVYKGPTPQKIVVHFWERDWFKITSASILILSLIAALYFKGRLMLQSKEHFVIQRERARIARDIHDDLSAGITQLIVFAEAERNRPKAGLNAGECLGEIATKARDLVVALRETIWVVDSQRDSLRDLAMFLCDYTESYLKNTQLMHRFDMDADLPTLTCDMGIRRNLFLAVKEALCNAVKHSEATEVRLRIYEKSNEIVVGVEDNGKGFDLALANHERYGLTNINQRAKDAGGTCSIISKPGAGCRVELRVPISHLNRFRFLGARLGKLNRGS